MLGVEVGILPIFHPFRYLELYDAVKGKRHQFHILLLGGEQKPPVAELLQQVWEYRQHSWMPRPVGLVGDMQHLLAHNVGIERIEEFQSFQVRHAVEMDDGLPVLLAHGKFVLKPPHHIGNLGELVEVLQLAQHIHRLSHQQVVVLRHGHLRDAVFGVAVTVILVVIDLDGRIVAQLVRPHHLEVALDGAKAHALGDALHVIQGVAARIHQIFYGPSAVAVSQTIVYGLVPYQGVFIGWHGSKIKNLRQKYKIFSVPQIVCGATL